jgi:hypothetical protein
MKDKKFNCKNCGNECREKACSETAIILKMCPQCITEEYNKPKIVLKSELEIRNKIKEIYENNKHILELPLSTIFSNSIRYSMQIMSISELDMLYWCLGETRPKYPCDKKEGA